MARIKIEDLPVMEDLDVVQMKGVFGGSVDQKVVGKAFKVEINGQFIPIRSYSGGDVTAEKAEASSGTSQHNESTMGHNYITELTLVNFITPTSMVLSDVGNPEGKRDGQN